MKGAGAGRPRKPEGQARNRNVPMRGTITIASSARVAEVPVPPLPMDGIRQQIWDSMWSQPIATLWNLGDLLPLARMVILQTTLESFTSKNLLQEVRQLEDRFLLNPMSRVQQRVVIEEAAADQSGNNVAWFEDAKRRLG